MQPVGIQVNAVDIVAGVGVRRAVRVQRQAPPQEGPELAGLVVAEQVFRFHAELLQFLAARFHSGFVWFIASLNHLRMISPA
jgi:hypothetical protein